MRRRIVLLMVMSIIVACSGKFMRNNPETTSYWRKYRGEFFPDSLTTFFPINNQLKAKSFETINISSTTKKKKVFKNKKDIEKAYKLAKYAPFFPYILMEVYIVHDEDEWNYWEFKAIKESSRSFLAGDTLAYFRCTVEFDYRPYETIPGYINEGKEAIPPFPQIFSYEGAYNPPFSKDTPCSLPPETKLYVIKSGHSCVIRADRKPHPFAPESMRQGYSSGIAVKRPYLYFWAVAW